MKKLIFGMALMLCSSLLFAAVHKHAKGHHITVPDEWVATLVGAAFYDADFVLTNINSGDFLLVNLLPAGYVFDTSATDLTAQQLQQWMQLFSDKQGGNSLFQPAEAYKNIETQVSPNASYVYFTAKIQSAKQHNQVLIYNNGKISLMLKVINKDQEDLLTKKQMLTLAAAMKPQWPTLNPAPAAFKQHPFALELDLSHAELTEVEGVETDDEFEYINWAFKEEDRLSRYLVSSQCSGKPVPAAMFMGMVMKDFGFDTLEYQGEVQYRQQKMPILIGKYKTSDSQFHTIGSVINDAHCQHVVAYVVENHESLLDRFLAFWDRLSPTGEAIDFKQMDSDLRARHNQTVVNLAQSMLSLEMYSKAAGLFQSIDAGAMTEDLFYGQINGMYNSQQYQKALDFIATHDGLFDNDKTKSWIAWSHVQLHQNSEALAVFSSMFKAGVQHDEDVVKYLELLQEAGQIDKYLEVADRLRSEVTNGAQIDFNQAKLMVENEMPGAKSTVTALLKNPVVVNKYQFALLDLLADLSAYEAVERYCLEKIDQGYESAGLWNYLGDAQNQLEKYDLAYESMLKSQQLAPNNTNIKSYVRTLRNKVGKSDLSVLSDDIEALELPPEVADRMHSIEPVFNDSSYEYLYQINAYHHQPGDANQTTRYGKIKINNLSGVHHNKTLKFEFNEEYENITINEFKVYAETGQLLTELDRSTPYITSADDGMQADHDKVLNVPVPSIGVGVMIEWVVSVANKTSDQTQEFIEMDFVSRVGHQYKALVFQGDVSNIAVDHTPGLQQQMAGEGWFYFESSQIANFKKTPYLPDLQAIFPWVKISSVKPTWVVVGDEYLQLINKKVNTDLKPNLLDLGPGFGALDDGSKVQKIADYVQGKLTYQALEFGWRAVIPNDAKQTLVNRYGDCKDHAVLLYDLLNSAGIKASLVLVNSDNDISVKLPTQNQFDHMIVYVPEVNGGMFLDTTDKDVSFYRYSPPANLQQYHALVMEPGESHLVQIPIADIKTNLIEVKRTVAETTTQYVYQERAAFYGHMGASLRSFLKSMEVDEVDSRVMSWVSSYYPDLTMDDFQFENLYAHDKPLNLSFKFSQDKAYATIILPVFIERYVMDFSQAPNRIWDFQLRNAFRIQSTTVLHKGSDLKLRKTDRQLEGDLTSWQIEANRKGLNFNAEVYANRKPAEDYQQLVDLSKQSIFALERVLEN